MPMRLIFTSGPRAGQAVDIDGTPITIGRVEADLEIPDEKVSRRHAVIQLEDAGNIVLRDLDSRNGTYVDEVLLAGPRVLSGGERLRFGDQQLQVEATPIPGVEATAIPRGDASPRSRRPVVIAAVAALLLLLAIVAQFVLPGVAENKLRSNLERYGPVERADVAAFPALKLLLQRADRVKVAMGSYKSEGGGNGSIADFLSDTRKTKKLDASVGTLDAGLVVLHDTSLHKDGDALTGRARLTQRDLADALPAFVNVRPVAASQNGIVVRARASALGRLVGVRLRVQADEGRLVVQPDGIPFGLARISVFKDPRVYVDSLGAELRGDQYLITVHGHLR